MTISKILLIICCLLGFIPCHLSQSVAISVSPDIIYLGSDVDITCLVSGNASALLSFVPFYVINGTYIQHSCVGSAEYQPLTQRFSTLPSNNSDTNTLLTRFSISSVSEIDNDLSIGCVFYDLETENNFSSQVIALSVLNTSEPITTVKITTTVQITEEPFINSQELYIAVGTVGGFLVLVIVISILIVLIISVVVVATKRNKRKEAREGRVETEIFPPITLEPDDNPSMLAVKKEDDLRDRVDSMKTYNESEAQRYSALPTYSLAVNMNREEFTESTDPSAENQFSGIDIEKEKHETDS